MGRAGNKAAAKKTPAPRSGNTQVVVVTGRLIDSNTVEIKGSKGRAAREITVHFSRRGVIVHGFQHMPDIDNLGFMVVADIPDSVSGQPKRCIARTGRESNSCSKTACCKMMVDIAYRQVKISEYKFARFLRRHGAINRWRRDGTTNIWFNDGGDVAKMEYNGPGGMCYAFWIRDISHKFVVETWQYRIATTTWWNGLPGTIGLT